MQRLVACTVVVLAVAAAPADARTIRYRIATLPPVHADTRLFALTVDAVLNDPRGWSLGGSVRFVRARRGAAWTVMLAAPRAVAAHGACSPYWSCYSGGRVLINARRWRMATPSYGRGRVDGYRRMVITHEVGHALGFGHAHCGGRGRVAPVMQQQSKGLGGCRRNPWPTAYERRLLAQRLGVRVRRRATRPLRLGHGIGAVRLGMTRAAVRAVAPEWLDVRFSGDRVVAVSTRSQRFATRDGARVGLSARRLRIKVPDVQCGLAACTAGRTTFVLSRGRVARVTVAYAASLDSSTSSRSVPQWSGSVRGRTTAFGWPGGSPFSWRNLVRTMSDTS